MDNFRKRTPQQHARKAIDGFLNTPTNRQNRFTNNSLRNTGRRPVQGLRPLQSTPKKPESQQSLTLDGSALRSRQVETEPIRRGHPHAKAKRRNGWRTWAMRGSFAVITLTIAMTGFLAAKGYLRLNQIFKGGGAAAAMEANVDPSKLKGEGDGRINILVLGRGGEGHDGPDLTDTLVLASIDPVNKKAALISLPRDTWVRTKYGNTKINAVFADAKSAALKRGQNKDAAEKSGIDAIESEVEDITGVNIHYYAMVDFEGFREAVDTVGGVTINVPTELRDPTMAWENHRNPVLAKAGPQHMDGRKALMYVRSRHGSARGDFDRAERQRQFIVALKSEIFQSGTYGNPLKVSKLMDNFGNHAKTDFNLNDLMRLYSLTKTISDHNVKSIGLADPPNDYLTTGTVGNQSVVRPKAPAGVFDYTAIRAYIRSQLPDGYIKKENAPIVVLNGTNKIGMATEVGEQLKTYSYNVTRVENAPTKDYANTIIVDLTGKNPYTKNYLEKRFHTRATRDLPHGIIVDEHHRSGFVIILGSNETSNF